VVPVAIPSRIHFPMMWRVVVIALIFIVAFSVAARDKRWAAGVLVVSAGVLVATYVAASQRRHGALLYGDDLPLRVGQPFTGYIDIELDQMPDSGFWLVLRCFEVGDRTNAQIPRWQNEVMIDAGNVVPMPGRLRISFAIEMPTEIDLRGAHWELDLTADGCAARFPLNAIASDGPPTVQDELLRPFESARESLRRP
jgi:hypothetical protein